MIVDVPIACGGSLSNPVSTVSVHGIDFPNIYLRQSFTCKWKVDLPINKNVAITFNDHQFSFIPFICNAITLSVEGETVLL